MTPPVLSGAWPQLVAVIVASWLLAPATPVTAQTTYNPLGNLQTWTNSKCTAPNTNDYTWNDFTTLTNAQVHWSHSHAWLPRKVHHL